MQRCVWPYNYPRFFSGRTLERLDDRTKIWDTDLRAFAKSLEKKKPVILTGDFNVAFLDADIYNFDAKHIAKTSGCTPQERESFAEWFTDDQGERIVRALH